MPIYERCIPCDKNRYATKEAAEADLARMQLLSSSPKTPRRAYPCPHGWWHLTSQKAPRWDQPSKEETTADGSDPNRQTDVLG